jgi:glycerate 2-kinase
MKIIIAPQAFKGSISALDAAHAMEAGVKAVVPDAETVLVPIADGGDGTLETLVEVSDGRVETTKVTGPLGKKVNAEWGAMGDGRTAVIEMARTSGLVLLKPTQLNALKATTIGLGEAIRAALDAGYRHFIIGIGGSATNDAGAGMAQALGIKMLDASGDEIHRGGAALEKLHRIDISGVDPRAKESTFEIACDVDNPLCGPEGASAVYGPQKGASPEQVEELDAALRHFSHVARRDLDVEVNHMPGAGAAGGLGAGMVAFLGASLRPGVDIVLEAVSFREKLEGADLVLTGEGQMDFQTVFSKAPIGVAKLADDRGIPVVGISGSLGSDYQKVHEHGIDAAFAITNRPMTLDEASANVAELITDSAEQVMRTLRAGSRVKGF